MSPVLFAEHIGAIQTKNLTFPIDLKSAMKRAGGGGVIIQTAGSITIVLRQEGWNNE